MRTPRVCCCDVEPSPSLYWVQCFGVRPHIYDEDGFSYSYMALFDSSTSEGQAGYQTYFGGVPSTGDVYDFRVLNSSSPYHGCGTIQTTVPAGRVQIPTVSIGGGGGTFVSQSGCSDNDCKTWLKLTPCGYPFPQDVSNPPYPIIGTDDYFDQVIPTGLPMVAPTTQGGTTSFDTSNTILVTAPGFATYCGSLSLILSTPSSQEISDGQPPSNATYARVDNSTVSGCSIADCLDLLIFEPCAGQPNQFKLAATVEDWEALLGVSGIDLATPSTYDGTWRYTRKNGNGSDFGCCVAPGGTQGVCNSLCGQLRLRNTQTEPNEAFCYCATSHPMPGRDCCGCLDSIAGVPNAQIQVIGNSGAHDFESLQEPPATSNGCTRVECTDCFPVNCSDGLVDISGEFVFNYSQTKTANLQRTTFSPLQSQVGNTSHNLVYRVKYTATCSYVENASMCDYASAFCLPPIDTSAPIVLGSWAPITNGIQITDVDLSGLMTRNVSVRQLNGSGFQEFRKRWSYVATPPGDTFTLPNGATYSTYPAIDLRFQKRWGIRQDIEDPQSETQYGCGSLSECYTATFAKLNWTPKYNWSGSMTSTGATPTTNYASGGSVYGTGSGGNGVGFEMVKISAGSDDVVCCEPDPGVFNGTIISANCFDTLQTMFLNENNSNHDQTIQSNDGIISSSVFFTSGNAPCTNGASANTPLLQCANAFGIESTATGPWCDGFNAGETNWSSSFATTGTAPAAWDTETVSYNLNSTMDHNVTSVTCR